jgi:hypothetical protein
LKGLPPREHQHGGDAKKESDGSLPAVSWPETGLAAQYVGSAEVGGDLFRESIHNVLNSESKIKAPPTDRNNPTDKIRKNHFKTQNQKLFDFNDFGDNDFGFCFISWVVSIRWKNFLFLTSVKKFVWKVLVVKFHW